MMLKLSMKLIAMVSALTLSSAFAGTPPVSASPLTPAQSERLKNVLSSAASWNELITYELKKVSGPNSPKVIFPNEMFKQNDTPTQPIDHGIIDNDCQVTVTPPEQKGILTAGDPQNGVSQQLPEFTADIAGPQCPIVLHAAVDGKQLDKNFQASFVITAKVVSADLAKTMDVDDLKVNMSVNGTFVQLPNSNNGAEIQVALTGGGADHSQKEGNVAQDFGMNMKMDLVPPPPSANGGIAFPSINMTMSESYGVKLNDFTAKLESQMTMQGFTTGTAVYKINGVSVSKEVYEAFRQSIQLPTDNQGQQNPEPGPAGNASTPQRCAVTIYKASDVSKAALLAAIQNKTPIAAHPLLDDSKCGQPGTWNVKNGSDMILASLNFQPQFVDFSVNVNGTKASGDLSVLADGSDDVGDQVGDYTYRLNCQQVPACQ